MISDVVCHTFFPMTKRRFHTAPTLLLLFVAGLSSCSTNNKDDTSTLGLQQLPQPKLSGSSKRPVNHLPRGEYPFDEHGNYMTTWAQEGDKKYGPIRTKKSRKYRKKSKKSKSRYHKVKRGDTLWGLSKRYGRSVSSIKRANGLRSSTIRLGQTLKIP